MEDRKREWIHKPVYGCGPLNNMKNYFRRRLQEFREEHKEFDEFLVGLHALLKKEPDPDYKNLCLFLEGEAEVNWITPKRGCMFDAFIKLFNLCLSPRQAYKYIKECHKWYLFMLKAEYIPSSEIEVCVEEKGNPIKKTTYLEFDIKPKREPICQGFYYEFRVKKPLKTAETKIGFDDDCVSMLFGNEKLKDALMLFAYYQNKNPVERAVAYIIKKRRHQIL